MDGCALWCVVLKVWGVDGWVVWWIDWLIGGLIVVNIGGLIVVNIGGSIGGVIVWCVVVVNIWVC